MEQQRNSAGAHAVDVRGDDIDVRRTHRDVGVAEARRRFGGLDIPATLVGMLTSLATLVLLGGLIGAGIGAIGYDGGKNGLMTAVWAIVLAAILSGLAAWLGPVRRVSKRRAAAVLLA